MAFTSHKIDGQKNVSQIRPDRQNSRRRKIKKQIDETLQVSCHDNLSEYLVNSTLHGLRYVGDRSISRFERIFFAIAFVLVVGLSIFFISVVWRKWNNKPLIIALSSNEYSIRELPFPGKLFTGKIFLNFLMFRLRTICVLIKIVSEKPSPFVA